MQQPHRASCRQQGNARCIMQSMQKRISSGRRCCAQQPQSSRSGTLSNAAYLLQAGEKRLKPSHLGGEAVIVGRKSEAAGAAAAKAGKQKKKGSRDAAPVKAKKMDYTKSGAVFKHLQEQRDAAEAATDKRAKPAAGTLGGTRPAAAFKL